MDERLTKALEFSNYMITLNNQKRILTENFYQDTIFYYKGGQFTVNKELLCFCHMMLDRKQESLVLIDDNDMPVQVEDLSGFVSDIFDLYFTASNKFLNEFNVLKNNRSIDKMLEI